MKHIAFASETFQNDLTKMQDLKMPIYIDLVKFFGHRWWDTSTFLPKVQSFFMDEIKTYQLDGIVVDSLPLVPDNSGRISYLRASFLQSRKNVTTQWSIDSIDLILGFIGGMSEVIWIIVSFLLGSYLNFHYESSMIRNFYGSSKVHLGSDVPEDEGSAKDNVKKSIETRKKYNYSYAEYLTTKFMKACCLNKCISAEAASRFERHADTTERLEEELNFIQLVRNLRVFRFMSRLMLRKYQRVLVQSFRKYQVEGGAGGDDPEIEEPESSSDEEEYKLQKQLRKQALQDLMSKFKPGDKKEDTAILYEITGF